LRRSARKGSTTWHPQRARDAIGGHQLLVAQPAAPGNAEPQRKEHQVDVAAGAILQRD